MNLKVQIMEDATGHNAVILPDIIFKNKQKIDWVAVEEYLQRYVGEIVTIVDTDDIIYIGSSFPDEYKGSIYTRRLRGAKAKVKANAVQGISEMVKIATDKHFGQNRKEKHSERAGRGWYYYTTRFAVPIYDNEIKTSVYNIYSARMVVNHAENDNMYLYDLVDIKREASTPLTIS